MAELEMRLTEHLRRYGLRHFDDDTYWEWASEKLGKKRGSTVEKLRAPSAGGNETPTERLRFYDYIADIAVGGPVYSQQTDDIAQATHTVTEVIAGCERVLDLGCAVGYATTWFAIAGGAERDVLGVDVSRRAVEVARTMAQQIGVRNARFVEMDIDRELPSGPFDAVVDMAAVQYSESFEAVIRRIKNVLSPEGVFVTVPQLGTAPEIRVFISAVERSGLHLHGFSWVYACDLGHNVSRPIMTWRLLGGGISVDLLSELRATRERLAGRIRPFREIEANQQTSESE